MFVHAKICVHKVTVGANLHHLIYKVLIDIALHATSLVALTEQKTVGWRLTKVKNWDNNKLEETNTAESYFTSQWNLLF